MHGFDDIFGGGFLWVYFLSSYNAHQLNGPDSVSGEVTFSHVTG